MLEQSQTEPCPACGSTLDVTGAAIFAERTCPVCATPINVRRKFGHYELMSVVGSGGQGVVYRAADNTLNRLVALKLLRTEYSNDPVFVKQFEHEARLTASINHPNVVRVYSFGADEGHVYLAMELVDGGTFDDLMEKLGRVPEARALQVGIEVAQGLSAGQEKGLIHRDVKPGNILFAADGTAKVVDYGLAMFFEQAALASGEIWGTPYYLSPERLAKQPEDFRSDIYSLGAALFHAIAGRPPFEAEDASHVALKHLRTQAVSLQTYAPDVSNATAYVINRTLAKNPKDRLQSYGEFIEQLQFARAEAMEKARGGGRQQHKSRVVLEDAVSKKAMSWITIATLVVVVAGLIVGGLLVSKAMRGKEDDVPAIAPAAAASAITDFGPGWAEAKAALFDNRTKDAEVAFAELAKKHPADSPERAWAVVHQALAAQLAGRSADAAAALAQAGVGTQVARFFSEQIGPKLTGADAVPVAATRDFSARNHQVLGALFLARRNFKLGHVDEAVAMLRQFNAMTPDATLPWLVEYKTLARAMQDELAAYTLASESWATALTWKDRAAAYPSIEALKAKISANSRIGPKAQALIAAAEKLIADDRAARAQVNFAKGAKASASGFDAAKKDTPERAVDGDLKTRWAAREAGEKWLALDLGTPRKISRWVAYAVPNAADKGENNFLELTLQRSDDGTAWTNVDIVLENHADVIDRAVPEFTARHIRILSTKGGGKATDTTLRIHELELGTAADQAKADYDPGLHVARRFSAASDLVSSAVGDPAAAPAATFDPAKGRYTLTAGGADIWAVSDHFHFAWVPLEGDGEMIARVTKIHKAHDWSKAGVMIRAGFAKDAPHGAMICGPGDKMQFMHRPAPAAPALATNVTAPLPRWVKVRRKGDEITGYHSADGKVWKEVARAKIAGLGPVAWFGLAACSHVAGVTGPYEFDSVTLTKK